MANLKYTDWLSAINAAMRHEWGISLEDTGTSNLLELHYEHITRPVSTLDQAREIGISLELHEPDPWTAKDLRAANRLRDDPVLYSSCDVEAALCVFEWMMDERDKSMKDWFDGTGWAAMRSVAADVGVWCNSLYEHVPEKWVEGQAWDWEIIPAMLDQLDWNKVVGFCQYGEKTEPWPATDEVVAKLVVAA
jgi:hypothetical protein